MKRFLPLLLLFSSLAWAQSYPCSGTPGATFGVYHAQCYTSSVALWICNKPTGCAVNSDWVPFATPIACVGSPGNTIGTLRQQCQTAAGVLYACNNTACTQAGDWVSVGSAGSGTLTNFAAGTLSPLFTTSVSAPTSSPVLSFTLSNAAPNTVLAGPPTGGAGPPTYQSAPTFSGANLTSLPSGSGSVVLTSGSGTPVASCAAPSSSNLAVYLDTTNQDYWWCSATNTWKKMLSVTPSGPYLVVGTTGTAPITPAGGSVACYFDSTSNLQVCLDSSGNASTMMLARYKILSCQPGLGDGLNAITAGTYLMSACLNEFGVTWTITAIKCYTDNNGTSTMNVSNGASTGLLTGAVTCTNSFASGTQSGTTTLVSADYAKFTFVADGTSKQATFVITGTR